ERFLTTVLFTDIIGSTELAAELGDHAWRELVQEHHRLVREALKHHGGREVDTAGDGFFAIFDAPAAAADCALDAIQAVQGLGIQIRAGLHVGEVEQSGKKVAGITVPTAARIMAATKVDEQPAAIAVGEGAVWVTNTESNTVSRIDPTTRAVVQTIQVGKSPTGITTGRGSVWVANSGGRSVSRINAATNRVVDEI